LAAALPVVIAQAEGERCVTVVPDDTFALTDD
jgi:hypothetical protein